MSRGKVRTPGRKPNPVVRAIGVGAVLVLTGCAIFGAKKPITEPPRRAVPERKVEREPRPLEELERVDDRTTSITPKPEPKTKPPKLEDPEVQLQYFRDGRYDELIEFFERFIRHNRHPKHLQKLAVAYFGKGDLEKAYDIASTTRGPFLASDEHINARLLELNILGFLYGEFAEGRLDKAWLKKIFGDGSGNLDDRRSVAIQFDITLRIGDLALCRSLGSRIVSKFRLRHDDEIGRMMAEVEKCRFSNTTNPAKYIRTHANELPGVVFILNALESVTANQQRAEPNP